ncbi:MAG: hypothetical protein ABIB93_07035, partial [Chloroflexota bacterium]
MKGHLRSSNIAAYQEIPGLENEVKGKSFRDNKYQAAPENWFEFCSLPHRSPSIPVLSDTTVHLLSAASLNDNIRHDPTEMVTGES